MPITPTPASCVACGGGGTVTDVCVTCPILVPSDHAEDSPAVSGDMGSFALAVRNDTLAVLTSANGDYSGISVDSQGRLFIAPYSTTSQARLLTNATPWTPADVTSGNLKSVRFQVISGTVTLVDSDGTVSAGIGVGPILEWSTDAPNPLAGPTSVTPSVGGSTLATWVEQS